MSLLAKNNLELTSSNLTKNVEFESVHIAYDRIKGQIKETPVITSNLLNEILGHEIYFKLENFQKTGSFKVRGALNTLISLKEKNQLPEEIVAYSSGNHGQAVAWAAKQFNIKTTIYIPKFVSQVKQNAINSYGANLINTDTRKEAEIAATAHAGRGAYFIHPSSHENSITGYATASYEVFKSGLIPDAIFTPCGGGGLTIGTYLAAQEQKQAISVYAVEPANANDAAISYRTGKIFAFEDSPITIADGARTLKITEKNFHYLKKISGFIEISEEDIAYWTVWVMHLLKIICEPTAALSLAGAVKWLREQSCKKKVLAIISGGNVDPQMHRNLWLEDYINRMPSLY
jgi:threonine dehydratase